MISAPPLRRRFARSIAAALPALCLAPARAAAPYLLDLSAQTPASVRARVGRAMKEPLVTIVDKPAPSPSGDAHDYVSYGRYWWPDPSKPDGLPYLQHDGHHNEKQVHLGDEPRLDRMTGAVESLALGWAVLHRDDCAARAGEWLRTWFVAPATRMNPNLEYSQIRLGHDNDHGSRSGVLDGRALADVADALRLLQGSPALSARDLAAIHAWFSDYLEWLLTARNAREERAAPNNHGSWFLVTAVTIARYDGRDDVARALCEEDRTRIGRQIRPDGSQPEELRRADGLGYSVFNLRAQFQVARLAAPLGVDLWDYTAPSGGSLSRALDYLRPYNRSPKSWPGRQFNSMKPGFLDPLLAEARSHILASIERVGDWQVRRLPEDASLQWTYAVCYAGLVAAARALPAPRLAAAVAGLGDASDWEFEPRVYHADDLCVGQAYAELFRRNRDPKTIAPLLKRLDRILADPREGSLDFDRKRNPDRQDRWSWCDALFMAPPVWAKAAAITGRRDYLEFMVRRWWQTSDYLYDRAERLFYRDSSYVSRREPNGRKVFWSRGNGWVIAGLARVLEEMPEGESSRPRFVAEFQEMAGRLAELQPSDGLWRASLLDPESTPVPETSGTGLICYALAWGVNHGVLDRARFAPVVERAWAGLVSCVDPDGKLTHVQPVGAAPAKFDPESTGPYGVGAFLLAGSEMAALEK